MADPKHTPGPWRLAPASEYAGADLNIDAKTRGYICCAGHRGDVEAEANARLIALTPDLLAMVYQYRDDMRHGAILRADSRLRRLEAIEAVIATVEGRDA